MKLMDDCAVIDGEAKSSCGEVSVVTVALVTTSLAVVAITTLTCCCICRRCRRHEQHRDDRDDDDPTRPLLNDPETILPSTPPASLILHPDVVLESELSSSRHLNASSHHNDLIPNTSSPPLDTCNDQEVHDSIRQADLNTSGQLNTSNESGKHDVLDLTIPPPSPPSSPEDLQLNLTTSHQFNTSNDSATQYAPESTASTTASHHSSPPSSGNSWLLMSSTLPNIVRECIREIERRGLDEEGLYRKCGRKSDVDALRSQFKNDGTSPDLTEVENIHVICSCLKGYLNNLDQCLLTSSLRSAFIAAADDGDSSYAEIRRTVNMMQPSHREMLAAVVIHLQRVAMSAGCRMTQSNLAIIFGPSVVGMSDPPDMKEDPRVQQLVTNKLLQIPAEFWLGTELSQSS